MPAKKDPPVLEKKPTEKVLLVALEQNWNHARHIESQRTTIANIYFLVVSGLVAIASAIISSPMSDWVIPLGILLTYIGIFSFSFFLIFLKHDLEFKNHIKHIEWITQKLELNKFKKDEEKNSSNFEYEGYMGLPLKIKTYGKYCIFTLIPSLLFGFPVAIGSNFLFSNGQISKYWNFAIIVGSVLSLIPLISSYLFGKEGDNCIMEREPKDK